ncbi:MAG: hypothetical protein KAI81_03820 [Candidatus Marinimicrobia bacterium]|nr:hypothetical protein [Candidatus Neomarinimicrobiota bacterium]
MIRVTDYGEALIKVNGKRLIPKLYNKGYEEFKEFPVPKHLYKDGAINHLYRTYGC